MTCLYTALNLYRVLAYPWQQPIETAAIVFQQSNQESVCFLCIHLQLVTVQAQEDVSRKEGNAFITVHERVVHDE